MPGHDRLQSLRPARPARRGFTLVELSMGVAAAAALALVISALFKAGILTARFSLGATQVLAQARAGLIGAGRSKGMLWRSEEASRFTTLSSTSLALGYAGSADVAFRLSGGDLLQNELGADQVAASGVSALSLSYYNLDASGRVMESTAAASAALVTMELTLPGDRGKTYASFAGARLRNKP